LGPNSISGPFAPYDAISPLTLGLLIVAIYLLWLRRAAQQQEQMAVSLTIHAITATLLGATFWYGCGLLLLNVLETVSPSKTPVTPENWTTAIALIVAGITYIALDILLRRRSANAALMSPLRGFVLTLLGGGIVVGATGGATALYAYATSLLGSPLSNWQYTAHSGLAAFVVSVIIVGLYLWTGMRAGFFSSSAKLHISPTPAASSSAIDVSATTTVAPLSTAQVIDELLAGKITRDEAISQIERLMIPR
ncbi:MAG: hypothetical protein JO125_06850, partial [Chloroflexi bacterium]|nr:hypothetical protein [Chloroflexota bacterium]